MQTDAGRLRWPTSPFSEVLAWLEEHGWVLQRTWPPYFVFVHPDHDLPLLIPVQEKKVSIAYIEKIKSVVEEGEGSNGRF